MQVKEISTQNIYTVIRLENIFNPEYQKYIVDDGGEEKTIPIEDAEVITS